MTQLEASFHYQHPPGEAEIRALKQMREIYGIFRLSFDEEHRRVQVEFDASRLSQDDIAYLLRNAGLVLLDDPAQRVAA